MSNTTMNEGKTKQQDKPSPLETVRQVLKDANLTPEEFVGGTGFVISLADELYEGGIAHIIEGEERFVFYLEFKEHASEKNFAQVCEFITRANYGILIGNFEMDYCDGSLRYKSSLDYQDDELSSALVRNAIVAARNSAETYGAALVAVMKGQKSPEAAINEVEGMG